MDTEAIRTFGSAPPVRSSPSRSSEAAGNPSLGSGGESEKADVVGRGGDVVSISPEARTQQPDVAKTKENASQTRIEVKDSGVVLKIVDSNTGQEIREIPAKEQQQLSQAIQDTVDKMVNSVKK